MLGLLIESDEWSDRHLAEELERQGFGVDAIDMAAPDAESRALACDCLANRVFASAYERGHEASVEALRALLPEVEARGIPMVNPPAAFAFETSKDLAGRVAAAAGVPVPATYALAPAAEIAAHAAAEPDGRACDAWAQGLRYPAILKPDCGGRGADTYVVHDAGELRRAAEATPSALLMLLQEYVAPELGFLTRIELVDGRAALVLKRSIGADGLSGYHHGSTYERYPDVPAAVTEAARRAAEALSFVVGSFDVIETRRGFWFIDFNSQSNVSEDCDELYGMDLMAEHAACMARRLRGHGA